jgi:hypothetical protein
MRSSDDLRKMKMSELQKRARAAGVDCDRVDDAADATDPRAELVGLIVAAFDASAERLSADLLQLKMSELQKRARAAGIDSDRVDDAADQAQPKHYLVGLIVECEFGTRTVAEAVTPESLRDSVHMRASPPMSVPSIKPGECRAMVSFNDATTGEDAEILSGYLIAQGVATFCTRMFCPSGGGGSSWRSDTLEAVDTCEFYVPLMNRAWQESTECNIESDAAFHKAIRSGHTQPKIVPILYSDFDDTLDKSSGKRYRMQIGEGRQFVMRSDPNWMAQALAGCTSASLPIGGGSGANMSPQSSPASSSHATPSGVSNVDELVAASGAERDEMLAFSKDDLVELMKELNVGVVVRNRLLKDIPGVLNSRLDDLAASDNFSDVTTALATFKYRAASEDVAEAYAKIAQRSETLVAGARRELRGLVHSKQPKEIAGGIEKYEADYGQVAASELRMAQNTLDSLVARALVEIEQMMTHTNGQDGALVRIRDAVEKYTDYPSGVLEVLARLRDHLTTQIQSMDQTLQRCCTSSDIVAVRTLLAKHAADQELAQPSWTALRARQGKLEEDMRAKLTTLAVRGSMNATSRAELEQLIAASTVYGVCLQQERQQIEAEIRRQLAAEKEAKLAAAEVRERAARAALDAALAPCRVADLPPLQVLGNDSGVPRTYQVSTSSC